MDPVEGADAAALRAGRHICGNGEVGPAIPDAGVVCAEDDEVLWLDGVDVRVVGDAECATASVRFVVGVEGRARAAWAGVVAGLDVASVRRGEVGRRALVAGYLAVVDPSSWELHEFAVLGRIGEMVVEPPLLEAVLHQGHDGSVVVVDGVRGHIETPHALVPKTCEKQKTFIKKCRDREEDGRPQA